MPRAGGVEEARHWIFPVFTLAQPGALAKAFGWPPVVT